MCLRPADDTRRATWATEGLPIDPLSVENGAIMTNAMRWSLMIDPQLQVGAASWPGLVSVPPVLLRMLPCRAWL